MQKIIIAALILLFPHIAHAQSQYSCSALREEASYGKEYKDLKYLLEGKDGWLFRSGQDLQADYGFRHGNDLLLQKLTKGLKSKGIDLVIAFPPTRGIAGYQQAPLTDPLANSFDPAMALRGYKKMIEDLNEDGVHIVGTPEVKAREGYFFKADHHWKPAGADEMAQAVATYIKTLPSYAALKKTEYKTVTKPEVDNDPTFGPAIQAICKKNVPPEKVALTETSPANAAEGDAILGDSKAEIVLVGGSNSNREINDLNFSGRLKEYLSADIYNAAISGGGIDDAIMNYLGSNEYKTNPPKIIIWEIPGYYALDGGVVGTRLRQLQAATFRACDKPIAESKGAALNGEVLQGQKIPSSTPYYFGVKFAQPIKEEFTATFTFDNGKTDELKYKPSKGYPGDGAFFYAPDAPADANLTSVSIKGVSGTADVSVCAFPASE